MPAARPGNFHVLYELCTFPHGGEHRCQRFTVVREAEDCPREGACYRPAAAALDGLYRDLRTQGFTGLVGGMFGGHHVSRRLVAVYGARSCEVLAAPMHAIENWQRLGSLMDRVAEVANSAPGPVDL
jgi:hypothetical protein